MNFRLLFVLILIVTFFLMKLLSKKKEHFETSEPVKLNDFWYIINDKMNFFYDSEYDDGSEKWTLEIYDNEWNWPPQMINFKYDNINKIYKSINDDGDIINKKFFPYKDKSGEIEDNMIYKINIDSSNQDFNDNHKDNIKYIFHSDFVDTLDYGFDEIIERLDKEFEQVEGELVEIEEQEEQELELVEITEPPQIFVQPSTTTIQPSTTSSQEEIQETELELVIEPQEFIKIAPTLTTTIQPSTTTIQPSTTTNEQVEEQAVKLNNLKYIINGGTFFDILDDSIVLEIQNDDGSDEKKYNFRYNNVSKEYESIASENGENINLNMKFIKVKEDIYRIEKQSESNVINSENIKFILPLSKFLEMLESPDYNKDDIKLLEDLTNLTAKEGEQSTSTMPPSTSTIPPSTSTMPPSTSTMPPSTSTMPPSTSTMPPSTSTIPPSTSTTEQVEEQAVKLNNLNYVIYSGIFFNFISDDNYELEIQNDDGSEIKKYNFRYNNVSKQYESQDDENGENINLNIKFFKVKAKEDIEIKDTENIYRIEKQSESNVINSENIKFILPLSKFLEMLNSYEEKALIQRLTKLTAKEEVEAPTTTRQSSTSTIPPSTTKRPISTSTIRPSNSTIRPSTSTIQPSIEEAGDGDDNEEYDDEFQYYDDEEILLNAFMFMNYKLNEYSESYLLDDSILQEEEEPEEEPEDSQLAGEEEDSQLAGEEEDSQLAGEEEDMTDVMPDGTITTEMPDGTITTEMPDGTITTEMPDGTTTTEMPDGTITTEMPDGTITTEMPDGTTTTEMPDGTTTTEMPDGTTTTTKSRFSANMNNRIGGPNVYNVYIDVDANNNKYSANGNINSSNEVIPNNSILDNPNTTNKPSKKRNRHHSEMDDECDGRLYRHKKQSLTDEYKYHMVNQSKWMIPRQYYNENNSCYTDKKNKQKPKIPAPSLASGVPIQAFEYQKYGAKIPQMSFRNNYNEDSYP